MVPLDLPGYAVGGLAVGETKPEMHTTLEQIDDLLPADKPRYLMGVGTPQDLVNGVLRGVDIFDCVLPTRMARNNSAMLRDGGRLNLKNAPFARDPGPIDPDCGCYTCRTFTRAYLRHLINAGEMLSATLVSIHNLHTLVHLARDMRQAILAGTFDQFAADFFRRAAEAGQ
jgi:queuine tRNA-ribosyltransferase